MRFATYDAQPLRAWGSLGRNHAAETGMMRGAVERRVWMFFWRAEESSAGVMR